MVSIRQKMSVAIAIFLVWFFFASFLYGNVSTNAFSSVRAISILIPVLFLGISAILVWSVVLHFAFFGVRYPLTLVDVACSVALSSILREPIHTFLGNIGIVTFLMLSLFLSILLYHYRYSGSGRSGE